MINKHYVMVICCLFMASIAFSQVSGTVTDGSSLPIPGVSVVLKGTLYSIT